MAGTSGQRIVSPGQPANAPSLSYESTAQHTWALILGLARRVEQGHSSIMKGGWQTGFATTLKGKVLGVLGLGRLGLMVARVAVLAFGMRVIAWSSSLTDDEVRRKEVQSALVPGSIFRAKSKEDLFRTADVLSIHYVLSERTVNLVGAEELALMKPTSFLVNTSRAPLVNGRALVECLESGAIAGAGLDVFEEEPLPVDSVWRTTKWGENGSSQVVLTPHMGYVEEQTIHAWYAESADSLEQWLDGKKPAVVLT